MTRTWSMIWWILLATWFAAATAPALAAISAFTQLQELGITLNDYHPFLGDNPEDNGRMAAGFVTDPIFRITDAAQIGLAAGCVLVAIMTRGRPTGGRSRITLACLGVAVIIIAVLALWLSPRMHVDLEAYRNAARANQAADATRHLEEFNQLHPIAEKLHGLRALAVLGMVAGSGFSARSVPGNSRGNSRP